MSTDTTPWRQTRAAWLDNSRAILDKADEEKRGLTFGEREELGTLKAKSDEILRKIDRAELQNNVERGEQERHNRAADGEEPRGGTGNFCFVDEDGSEFRSLAPGESFATAVSGDAARALPSNAAGRIIIGAITGHVDRLPEELRDYVAASDIAGGFQLAPEVSGQIIDKARALLVMSQAGCQVLPMKTEQLRVVKIETDPTATWVAEKEEIPESAGTFGAIELRARTIAVYCEMSLDLARDASNAAQIVEDTIAESLAKGLDQAMLSGPSGSGTQPTGLLYSGVDTLAVNARVTMDHWLRASEQAWENDVEPDTIIFPPKVRGIVARTKDGLGLPLGWHPELANHRKLTSTQVTSTSTDTETSYIGTFRNCLLGIRSPIEIQASDVAGAVFRKRKIAIRGFMRADFAPGRNNDIVRLVGIST